MPRVTVTVNEKAKRYPVLPVPAGDLDFAFTPGDVSAGGGLQYAATGREAVIVRNTDAVARTVTLKSVADELNRTGDITAYSIGAGEFMILVPPLKGFQQADGNIYIDMEDAKVEVAVLRLPTMN